MSDGPFRFEVCDVVTHLPTGKVGMVRMVFQDREVLYRVRPSRGLEFWAKERDLDAYLPGLCRSGRRDEMVQLRSPRAVREGEITREQGMELLEMYLTSGYRVVRIEESGPDPEPGSPVQLVFTLVSWEGGKR